MSSLSNSIQLEHPLSIRPEIEQLLELHWQEVAKNKDLMVLNPRWEVYDFLTNKGDMFTFTSRDSSGRIVGYSSTVTDQHLHYAGLKIASNDVIYLHPDHRNKRAGLELIIATEDEARRRNAKLMLWHAKPDTPLDYLLRSRGLPVQDVIYSNPL